MELVVPPPPPSQEFHFATAPSSPYVTAPCTPGHHLTTTTNPFSVADDDDHLDGNPFSVPSSANPFDLPPRPTRSAIPRLSNPNPFDLFTHFISAPASPARAAAIYAQFAPAAGHVEDEDDDDLFQPRASFSTATTTTSSVPFHWEEKPGTPKPHFAAVTSESDFEFAGLVNKDAPPPEPAAADELFERGKIRPLKPPPRMHDGCSSVSSSPRSPMQKAGGLWSPRRRSRVGSGADFDPFAVAMVEATKDKSQSRSLSPSPLRGGTGSGSLLDKPDPATQPPATAAKSGGKKKWRLRDLLLFRSASDGRVDRSKDPIFKYSPMSLFNSGAMSPSPAPVKSKKASASEQKKYSKKSSATVAEENDLKKNASPMPMPMPIPIPHRQTIMGRVRLNPGLHRLAKGFNVHSTFGRGPSGSATKG